MQRIIPESMTWTQARGLSVAEDHPKAFADISTKLWDGSACAKSPCQIDNNFQPCYTSPHINESTGAHLACRRVGESAPQVIYQRLIL